MAVVAALPLAKTFLDSAGEVGSESCSTLERVTGGGLGDNGRCPPTKKFLDQKVLS